MLGKNTRGHYEPIQRVPTIWYWKNNFGPELVQSFTTNLDIFPTVCDLVGLEPPLQTQGNSVADILRFSPSGPGPGPESSEMVFFDSSFTKSVRTRQYMHPVAKARCTTVRLDRRSVPGGNLRIEVFFVEAQIEQKRLIIELPDHFTYFTACKQRVSREENPRYSDNPG